MGWNGGYLGYDATPTGDGTAPGIWGLRDVRLAIKRGTWPVGLPTGMLRWYDASQITGLSDGDPVSQWDDKSANADHAVQATSANQPNYKTGIINGKPVVRFDGSNDWLALSELFDSSSAVAHMFVVAAPSTSGARALLSNRRSDGQAGWSLRHNPQTTLQYFHAGGGATPIVSYTVAAQANIIEVQRNGLNAQLGANGALGSVTAISTYVASSADRTLIGTENDGTASFFAGDIAEIILYPSLLATGDRSNVLTYLADKYAITLA